MVISKSMKPKTQEFSNRRHLILFTSVKSLAKEKLHTFARFIPITQPLKINGASASSALQALSPTVFLLLIVGNRRITFGLIKWHNFYSNFRKNRSCCSKMSTCVIYRCPHTDKVSMMIAEAHFFTFLGKKKV
jgi:hypothetical protein